MFRLTHYMKQLIEPTQVRRSRGPMRPVVIWNLTRRCNLKCRHCYAVAADHAFPGELTSEEAFAVLDDLVQYRIPALILSGGEPLARADTLDIARRAKSSGLYTALSSNGTTIDDRVADDLAANGQPGQQEQADHHGGDEHPAPRPRFLDRDLLLWHNTFGGRRSSRDGRGPACGGIRGSHAVVVVAGHRTGEDRLGLAVVEVDDVGDDDRDVVRAAAAQRQFDEPVGTFVDTLDLQGLEDRLLADRIGQAVGTQ